MIVTLAMNLCGRRADRSSAFEKDFIWYFDDQIRKYLIEYPENGKFFSFAFYGLTWIGCLRHFGLVAFTNPWMNIILGDTFACVESALYLHIAFGLVLLFFNIFKTFVCFNRLRVTPMMLHHQCKHFTVTRRHLEA